MKPRPYILSETNWKTVKEQDYQVAVLPWGATEAHNYHLPYGTDTIQCDHIAAACAQRAWELGSKPIVLPTVPFGVNSGQLDIDLCLNMNPSTQLALLQDLIQVLELAGIHKLVIFNGHGGNSFKSMIRELSVDYPDVFVCSLNWYQAANQQDVFDEPGDHAGEMETSCIMHIAPDWVLPLDEAGSGAAKSFVFKGMQEGWVTAQRSWTKVTDDTGVGNPKAATADKGARYIAATAEQIGQFLYDLAITDSAEFYA